MTYEMYRYVFLGAAIASGVFFVISAILFFALRIPKVISDLTGRTARKAIENIRMQNEQTGDKTFQSSAANLARGKITDRITESGRLIPRDPTPFGTGAITEKIATQQLHPQDSAETTVLSEAGETEVLDSGAGETTLLDSGAGETTVLAAAEHQPPQVFSIEYEITYIHTDEIIV